MEKIQLTCSSCGGKLIAIETKENTYVCTHCGNQEIITKEASKQNYYINQNIVKNIYGKEQPTEEDYYKLVKNAEKFMGVKDYLGAIKFLNQAVDIDPGNYLAWWIRVKSKLAYNSNPTENLLNIKRFSEKNIQADYDKAYAFADNNQKAMIAEEVKKIQETMQEENSAITQNNTQTHNTSASFGSEVSLKPKQIICMIFAILALGFSITAAVMVSIFHVNEVAILPCLFWFVLSVILFISSNNYRLQIYIINYIKQNKKVSFEQILQYVNDYKKQTNFFFRLSSSMEKEALISTIHDLIINNNLIGYKIEGEYIIDDNYNYPEQ